MKSQRLGGLKPLALGKQSVKEFLDDDMVTYAAALAYHALFALFPFLIFLLGLLSVLHIPGFFSWLLEQAQTAFPADAYQRVQEVVTQVQGQARGGALSFGILTALWAASSGMRALMNALNTAYDVEESRPAWQRYLFSVLYTVGLAILVIAAAALMLLGPQAMEWLADQAGLGGAFVAVWTWLRWPVAVLLLMLTAAIIYYVAPNVEQPFAFITPGAVLAVIVWIIASLGFSLYVANVANYSATYGSLGGVVVLLFYFFISAAVLLLGAEINSEVHHAKIGAPEPKGDEESEDERDEGGRVETRSGHAAAMTAPPSSLAARRPRDGQVGEGIEQRIEVSNRGTSIGNGGRRMSRVIVLMTLPLLVLSGCGDEGDGDEEAVATELPAIPPTLRPSPDADQVLEQGIEGERLTVANGSFDVETLILQVQQPVVLTISNQDADAYRFGISSLLNPVTVTAGGTTMVEFTTPTEGEFEGRLYAAEGDEIVSTIQIQVQEPGDA